MSVSEIFENMEYGPAPEDAAKVRDWLQTKKTGFGHFIGGKWLKGDDHFNSTNPANGEVLGKVATAGSTQVNAAVKAANTAYAGWSKLPPHKRARVLYALARLIQKNSRFIAVLETLDNGKPIRETRDADIPLAARHFYYHAGWAQLLETELSDQQSLGVVGQIIPWNFPFLMLSWKIAPALAAGNCVVLKPAEYTSLSALYFAELCVEAGVPPGVVNIVTGKGKTGGDDRVQSGLGKAAQGLFALGFGLQFDFTECAAGFFGPALRAVKGGLVKGFVEFAAKVKDQRRFGQRHACGQCQRGRGPHQGFHE